MNVSTTMQIEGYDPRDNQSRLEEAAATETPILFFYRHPITDEEERRKRGPEDARWRHVSPYEVRESLKGDLYLVGWDNDEDGVKNWRLERIDGLVTTDPNGLFRPAEEV